VFLSNVALLWSGADGEQWPRFMTSVQFLLHPLAARCSHWTWHLSWRLVHIMLMWGLMMGGGTLLDHVMALICCGSKHGMVAAQSVRAVLLSSAAELLGSMHTRAECLVSTTEHTHGPPDASVQVGCQRRSCCSDLLLDSAWLTSC
jgi:hypothetical protein